MTAQLLGTIEELWRYPVSSLGGERLTSVTIASDGIPGDRIWCIVDPETGQPAAPEKEPRWRPALFLSSRLPGELPEIGFPDGSWLLIGDRDLESKLTGHFGFTVSVRPYAKAGAQASSDGPVAINRYQPSPLHLLTTGSIEHLKTLAGTQDIDSRRFRPTVLLRTEAAADFMEKAWIGQGIELGQTILRAVDETKRCGLTLIPQPGLSENPDILRSILRQNRRNLGIYCSIDNPGTLSVGDDAYLAKD